MPDCRKPLNYLRAEWKDCKQCELGVRRAESGGDFVFGEGEPGGILFVGEGPGKTEEELGRPFVGESGRILRTAINALSLKRVYITNVVCCRSCEEACNSEGQVIRRWIPKSYKWETILKDETPKPLCIAACLPRLYEEIYLVDPVLIVTLGLSAIATLSTTRVTAISTERGKTRPIGIPGAGYAPVLTPKRRVWRHTIKGEVIQPVEQNRVEYLTLPTFHPAHVLRQIADKRQGNPREMFTKDLIKAAIIYNRYMKEVHNINPTDVNYPNDLLEGVDA